MHSTHLEADLFFLLAGMQQFDEIIQGGVAFRAKHAAEAFVVLLQ